jgi:hypothetical protein
MQRTPFRSLFISAVVVLLVFALVCTIALSYTAMDARIGIRRLFSIFSTLLRLCAVSSHNVCALFTLANHNPHNRCLTISRILRDFHSSRLIYFLSLDSFLSSRLSVRLSFATCKPSTICDRRCALSRPCWWRF